MAYLDDPGTRLSPVRTTRMTDEKRPASRTSSLLDQVNAAPFVPQSSLQDQSSIKVTRSGSSTNINAKPFTPNSARTSPSSAAIVADSKASLVSPKGSGFRGINAGASAFVPAGSNGHWPPTPSAAAGYGSGQGTPNSGERLGRSSPQPKADGYGPPSYTPSYDSRGNYMMPGPIPLPSPRGTRGRGLSPRSTPSPLPAARGSRYSPGSMQGGAGRGRGMMGNQGSYAGMGALGRAHHAAAVTVDQLVLQLQMQPGIVQSQMPAELQMEQGYPDMLQHFHSLYPLDDLKAKTEQPSRALGVQSWILKGISMHDGAAFAIRRFSWRQVQPSPELLMHANQVVEAWSVLGLHPNLAVPRLAFVSAEMGGRPALFMAYDFYPSAVTLEAAHMQPQVTPTGLVQASVSEDAAWGYFMQLAAALRAVHSMGLACRAALAPSKVLLLPGNRLRLGSLGLAEVLAGNAARQEDIAALQREDLALLGQLMLQLLCGSLQHPSLEQCSVYFSRELTQIVASLIGLSQDPIISWPQLTNALRDHTFVDLDSKHMLCDAVVGQLGKEIENGRLLRLLIKLSTITERADTDTQWAETGDRYLLKLFRDFVFHQCTEDGLPILDWAHVAEALNKLDAGLPEKIVLMSRDEASMLVVSYADVKNCLDGTYNGLKKLAFSPPHRG